MTSKNKMSPRDKDPNLDSEFNKALALRKLGDYQGALKIFRELNLRHPNYAPILSMIGILYIDLGKHNDAVQYLRKNIVLSPRSHLASRNLFHSLYELEDYKGALIEMKRFLSISYHEDYEMIIKDQEFLDMISETNEEDYSEIIRDINALLSKRKG